MRKAYPWPTPTQTAKFEKLFTKLRIASITDEPGQFCFVYTGPRGAQKVLTFNTEAEGRKFANFLHGKYPDMANWDLRRQRMAGGSGWGDWKLYVELPASPLRILVPTVPEGADFQI